MTKLRQYVNVASNELFVDAAREVASVDRLGPVRFKAKFKKPDTAAVSFRFVKVSEVSPYTDAEKKRCFEFNLHEPIGLDVSEGEEVEAWCVGLLPASGGGVYKVEARAGDKTLAASDEIESWRLLFFQVLHMKDVSAPDLQPTCDYYKKLFIHLLDVPAKAKTEIPYVESATSPIIRWLVQAKYQLTDYEPWAMALAFVDQLPSMIELKYGTETGTGEVSLPARISGNQMLTVELPGEFRLWHGFDRSDDASSGGKGIWLQSDATLEVGGKTFSIPQADIELDKGQLTHGRLYKGFVVKLPADARNTNLLFGKTAKLSVKLLVLSGFSGGCALLNENLVVVANRSWFRTAKKTDAQRLQVLNHEFGHKLGMVPKGGRPLGRPNELDAPDSLYGDIDKIYGAITAALQPQVNSKGHRGAHCALGAKARGKGLVWKWSGTPKCTMFGATSTSDAEAPAQFCPSCEKLVMRLHLNPASPDGPQGFRSLR